MILESIMDSRHFERIGLNVTGLKSLLIIAIVFLLVGIISLFF